MWIVRQRNYEALLATIATLEQRCATLQGALESDLASIIRLGNENTWLIQRVQELEIELARDTEPRLRRIKLQSIDAQP